MYRAQWIGSGRELRRRTAQSARFANVLGSLGVGLGDRVFVLLPRTAELFIAALGTLRNGSVFAPLYAAFGPDPLRTRLVFLGGARVLVTTESIYRRRLSGVVAEVPTLQFVLVIADGPDHPVPERTRDLAALLAAASEQHAAAPTAVEDPALLHFTSGTTGRPKGAVHVHGAALMHYMTGKYALDLHPDDVFWCTADPGWVTGTSYGIMAPLVHGVTSLVDEGDFDAERWYRVLAEQRVTVWYTAPTAIRMLMKAGAEPLVGTRVQLSLRCERRRTAQCRRPCGGVWRRWPADSRQLVADGDGGIIIANTPSQDISPGSMGRPLPG